MYNNIKKYRDFIRIIIVSFLVAIICPIIIEFFTHLFVIDNSYNTWIDFNGSYIGSILGGLITLYVMYTTIKKEKCEIERREKIEYFDTIIKLVSEYESKAANVSASIDALTYGKCNSIEISKLTNDLGQDSLYLNLFIKIHKRFYGIQFFESALSKTDNYINSMNKTISEKPNSEKDKFELREKTDEFNKEVLVELQNATVQYALLNIN